MRSVKDDALLRPLGIQEAAEVESCVHGTYLLVWEEILRSGGLCRMARNHIHFTTCTTRNAEVSGMRSDCEVVIYISLTRAIAAGLHFFRSTNGVVLTPGDERGMVSIKHFEKVIALRDGSILWPDVQGASTTATSSLAHDGATATPPIKVNLSCQNTDAEEEDEEVVCFSKPLLHMYI